MQDFDPEVQKSVNRIQSWDLTAQGRGLLRARGIKSINVDLMYGLPDQTEAGMADTVDKALDLGPDRVAVFGYAHVPWMAKHQSLLPEEALPGALERWGQLQMAERVIAGRGYRIVGMDHYRAAGRPPLDRRQLETLRRNFQGYTTDQAEVMIGLGASSIGSLPEGYVQNAAALPEWRDKVRAGEIPTKRGVALDAEDRLRRDVIEQLMCQGRVNLVQTATRHGADPAGLQSVAPRLEAMAADGVVEWDGNTVAIRAEARPFVRTVAAVFDTYLRPDQARHARVV